MAMKRQKHISAVRGVRDIDFINVGGITRIMKSRIQLDHCDNMIKRYDQIEVSNSIESVRNLLDAEKSDWNILNNTSCDVENLIIKDKIHDVIRRCIHRDDEFNIQYADFWYAKYSDKSFIAPHDHGDFLGRYSFCVYLDCEPEGTLLYYTTGSSTHVPILFHRGDIAIFPSGLPHWSNDVYEGRKIVAGNFVVNVRLRPPSEEVSNNNSE